MLDGRSYVEVAPLPVRCREKTLEAWVQCANLEQRGGGVMSIQSTDGVVFDAIVFAEKDRRHWLAGQQRLRSHAAVQGPASNRKPTSSRCIWRSPTHPDGTITGYRNGQPYGRSYVTEPNGDVRA